MRTTAQDLIERAAKYDPVLAADIRAFAKSREYGLIFEHNRPEAMRLYGKKIAKGDVVHILAKRGEQETESNRVPWRVQMIYEDKAIVALDDVELSDKEVDICDLVAVAEYDHPIYAGLRETGRIERSSDKPYQIVINGENYHALETLLFAYEGRVDCIYIDPPYNTGAKDWKYNNDYVDGSDQYRHSKWLAMMERRLKLAKRLLNPNESILICTIDEKEYLRLGLLLEQVFIGQKIQMISSVVNPAGVARQGEFARTDEYIFFIFVGQSAPDKIALNDEWLGGVSNSCKTGLHWNALMRTGTNSKRIDRPNLFYPIYVSKDGRTIVDIGESLPKDAPRSDVKEVEDCYTIWPIRSNGEEGNWQISQSTLRKAIAEGFVKLGKFTKNGMAISYLKKGEQEKVKNGLFPILGYRKDGSIIVDESEYEAKYIPGTQWRIASHDASRNGSGILRNCIPGRQFAFPKSLYAVEDTIRFFVANKPDAIIIDFFAGSGTTAHAVMRLNHQDNGKRKCICITNNEVGIDEVKTLTKQNLRQGDTDWEVRGICEYITKPRIKAAITGKTPEGQPIKGDYKFIDEFPMSDGFEENAVFFDLTYEDPNVIDLGGAFEAIAPLLWMRAGCKGKIIEDESDGKYSVTDTYAVLFDYSVVQQFIDEVGANPELRTVYVVTDDESRYKSVCKEFPDRDVVRLYESYLRSFEIAAEGALN